MGNTFGRQPWRRPRRTDGVAHTLREAADRASFDQPPRRPGLLARAAHKIRGTR